VRISPKNAYGVVWSVSRPTLYFFFSKALTPAEETRTRAREVSRHQSALEEAKRAREFEAARKKAVGRPNKVQSILRKTQTVRKRKMVVTVQLQKN